MKHDASAVIGTSNLSSSTRAATCCEALPTYLGDVAAQRIPTDADLRTCLAGLQRRRHRTATKTPGINPLREQCNAPEAQGDACSTERWFTLTHDATCLTHSQPRTGTVIARRVAVACVRKARARVTVSRKEIDRLPNSHALQGIASVGCITFGWSWPVRWRGIKSLPPPLYRKHRSHRFIRGENTSSGCRKTAGAS